MLAQSLSLCLWAVTAILPFAGRRQQQCKTALTIIRLSTVPREWLRLLFSSTAISAIDRRSTLQTSARPLACGRMGTPP